VHLYRYFLSQSSEFCSHNPLSCFLTSVCCCKRIFHYRLISETLDTPSYESPIFISRGISVYTGNLVTLVGQKHKLKWQSYSHTLYFVGISKLVDNLHVLSKTIHLILVYVRKPITKLKLTFNNLIFT